MDIYPFGGFPQIVVCELFPHYEPHESLQPGTNDHRPREVFRLVGFDDGIDA